MQTVEEKFEYDFKKNHVFGRLILTGFSYFKEMYGQRRRMVTCKCECGIVRDYVYDLVKKGQTKSCGCLKIDLLKENPHAKSGGRTHGLRNHPVYRVWDGMKQRCYNPNATNYSDYGGRNISIKL